MKKISGDRFRELSDIADRAVEIARKTSSPEELSTRISAVLPDGTELFSWDHDRRVWMAAIICNADRNEVIPFIVRRDCLHQLIAENPGEEFGLQFIRPTEEGFALHPAIYHAAGNATVVGENEETVFDRNEFEAALLEWVQSRGY